MIKLTGKTLKGKNLVRRWGSTWEILVEKDDVLCFDHEAGMLIQATEGGRDKNHREESRRWIRLLNPRDFSVEVIDD